MGPNDGSIATSISDDGVTTVGTSGGVGFRHTAGTGTEPLGSLPDSNGEARPLGISGDGSIIVGTAHAGADDAAFIWDEVEGMRALEQVLSLLGVDLTGWDLKEATGVSDDGRKVVGWGINPEGQQEAFVATIPEPGTALLVGFGLAGLALRRR